MGIYTELLGRGVTYDEVIRTAMNLVDLVVENDVWADNYPPENRDWPSVAGTAVWLNYSSARVPLPDVITVFIRKFDSGSYRRLRNGPTPRPRNE
jgi:hypothetical protein